MGSAADNIFPLILDSLSQMPLLEETEYNLFKDVQLKVRNEGLKIKNLKKEFDQALEIGQQIGILRLIDRNVRLPFFLGLRNKNNQVDSIRSKSVPRNMDKERRSRRRGSSSHRRRQSRSRSRSGRGARSQNRKRRSSRK